MNLKIPGKKTIIATIATMIQMLLLKLLCFITIKFCHKGKQLFQNTQTFL